ncbi:MAG: response regulator [Candidatus Pacebacteria bacterium]|nr:response regulator [Candidatus Paceibacterota bacterium]
MKKRIIIGINNDSIRDSYSDVFKKDFKIFAAKDGIKLIDLAKKQKPDLVIADISLSHKGGFEILKELNKKKIPIVIFAPYEKEEERKKAIELEAKDFVSPDQTSPFELLRKVKIILGQQKSYRLNLMADSDNIKKLMKDLGYKPKLKCDKCNSDIILYLIRDFSKGESHFIVSFICPKCG